MTQGIAMEEEEDTPNDIRLDFEYLDEVDQEISLLNLDMEDPEDRAILSMYCREVGLYLFHKYYYRTKSTTRYLELWKWWASTHKLSTHNFDYWWDHKFL